MKIMVIVAGAVTGALLTVLLLAGAASFVRAEECMRAMEWQKNGLRRAWDNPCPA